jgi:AhpD family alkylhydroperoxidase
MSIVPLIEYADAAPEVRAVYDDIKTTRNVADVNNFWKALANHPPTLKQVWDEVKQVMGPGALDPVTRELIYIAVSATNGCDYCTTTHTASARTKGATSEQILEALAVAALANKTNRLANGYRVPVDAALNVPPVK